MAWWLDFKGYIHGVIRNGAIVLKSRKTFRSAIDILNELNIDIDI